MSVWEWTGGAGLVLFGGLLVWGLFFANRRSFPFIPAAPAPDETRNGAMRTTLRIPTPSGDIIEAWLHTPSAPRPPVVVMAPGLCGTKEGPLELFAWAFAAAGFAVVSFDLRSFGGSAGLPRHNIDLRDHIADYLAVIAHLRGAHAVELDTDRLILWGTSFSGASAACAAATPGVDPAALILHVPYLGQTKRGPAPLQLAGYIALSVAEEVGNNLARLVGIKLPSAYITAYGRPDERAFAASAQCPSRHAYAKGSHPFWKLVPETFRGGWRNQCLVGVLRHLQSVDPAGALAKLTCPTLILAARHDDMIGIEDTRRIAAGCRSAEFVEFDAGHFDPYCGALFEDNAARQVAFLARTLGEVSARDRPTSSRPMAR